MCLLRCAQYGVQSRLKSGLYFWLAAVLVFVAVIRRELNHVPELLISSDFLLLGYGYDWWEDIVLLLVYLMLLGLLIYAWRYLWAVLKNTHLLLYTCVAALAIIQYMGENAIGFSENVGMMIEELTEIIIYVIALSHLWRLKPNTLETAVIQQQNTKEKRQIKADNIGEK